MFLILCLLPAFACFANLEDFFVKFETEKLHFGIDKIDRVYLINLNQRPEKWDWCLRQLIPYGIYPQKVPAIYGWTLDPETLNQIGVRFEPGMWVGREPAIHYHPSGDCTWDYLNPSCYGKTFFSLWTSKGAIGCALSHLSTLQDAYDAGYETIWILEDDIAVWTDPHKLSTLIEKLDSLVGKDGWDMLFTDELTLVGIDPTRDILSQCPMMWRPDHPYKDLSPLLEKTEVGEDFIRIGSRIRFHSVIYRRSGIEKILQYYKQQHIFMPIDHEVFFVPGIRPFVTKKPIVTLCETTSDTRSQSF